MEVIDFGAEDTNPRVERGYFPSNSEPESIGEVPEKMSDGMLRKLIDNVNTSFALKNQDVRGAFRLNNIKVESDLHEYKNLLNAMAALFFTNHSMSTLSTIFKQWH